MAPVAHTDSPLSVVSHSWYWASLLVVLAVGGIVISCVRREQRARIWLFATLTMAVIVGTAEQGWLDTTAVLNRRVGLGAWLTAIAAGYAADRFMALAPAGREQALASAFCIAALVFPVYLGAARSGRWPPAGPTPPASPRFSARWPTMATGGCWWKIPPSPSTSWSTGASGRDDPAPATSSFPAGPAPAARPPPRASLPPATRLPSTGTSRWGTSPTWPSTSTDAAALDHGLATLLRRNPSYHTVQVVPYGSEVKLIGQGTYVIWKYEPRR